MTVWQRRAVLAVIALVFTYIWTGFIDLQVLHHDSWQARSVANQRARGVLVAETPRPELEGRILHSTRQAGQITPRRVKDFLRRCVRKARFWTARTLRS